MNQLALISIVIPVFNEELNIEPCYNEVRHALLPLAQRYKFEFVFTDNHSIDTTWDRLRRLAKTDPDVRAIRFSRNFGYQRSIMAGYLAARGVAAIQLDCDLQDPPELITRFLELWEAGNKVVYGVRASRKEAWHLNFTRNIFYRTINYLSEDAIPIDAGDFRLVDRCILEELRLIRDANPYLRGTIATMGFPQAEVIYDREERKRGETKFSFGALVGLAFDGVLNHSVVPLRIASFIGILSALATIVGIGVYGVGKYFFGQKWPAGFATMTILLLLSICLNALFLGIIGEYLGRIYRQVKYNTLVIREETLNLDF
jgi:glycosyltransferase involved in cell wall biosynthesis